VTENPAKPDIFRRAKVPPLSFAASSKASSKSLKQSKRRPLSEQNMAIIIQAARVEE